MKIRSGFVSNSSSSSFIISDKSFKSVRDLATYMINVKYEQYIDNDMKNKEYDAYSITEYNSYINILKNIDENQAITFQSCNYDTYIKKVADRYLVSTCNNEDWELYEYNTKLSDDAISELRIIQQNYKVNSDDWNTIEYLTKYENDFDAFDNDYYSLDFKIVGKESSTYCPKCKKNGDYYDMWNTKKHGLICLVCNPIYKRKDKLDEINKNI